MSPSDRDRIEAALLALRAVEADLRDIAMDHDRSDIAVRACCTSHSVRDWLEAKRRPN